MYIYTFELLPAKKNKSIDYTSFVDIFKEATHYINKGLSFTRDGKELIIKEVQPSKLIVILKSRDALKNPTRSLSALTRYLTTYYPTIFTAYIYNKTLFSMTLIQTKQLNTSDFADISNEEMLKGIIDLVYAYTAKSASDIQNRNKTIKEIKALIKPYLNNSNPS